jgi:hypothetical protein
MKLEELTVLMHWIDEHAIDQYVKIAPLKDAILDLFENVIIEPTLNEVN